MKVPRTLPKEFQAHEVLDTMVDRGVSFGIFREVRRVGGCCGYCGISVALNLWYCLGRVRYSGEKCSTILNSGGKLIVTELIGVIGFHQPKN